MSEVKICPTCGSEYPMSERFCPRDGSALKSQNAQADLVGSMVANSYHVIKKLGEGGMGAVYLAEHVKMGRKSAIKVMNPGMNQDSDAIARFNREASNAARMNHPNICAIYDFGETSEGLIYLAMEFIEGESLTSLIEKNGSLAPMRAASILHQAADGLQVAHDYGIVHRDLKPDNIMIAKGREGADLVKVVDFGIAKASSNEAQKVTKTGLVVGTPEYMSPEQLAGDKLDGRSDIYSLALVGFNMLTGTLPFPSNSAQEAMIMRLTDQPKSLADMKPGIEWPEQLQAVMDKALARDVNERYQKAADFGRDFYMAIEAMPATAAAEGATMVIGAASASAKTAPVAAVPKTRVATPGEAAKATPAATPTKSSKGMVMGIGGFVVVAAVVAVFVFKPSGGAGAKSPGVNPDTANKVAQNPPAADPNTKPANTQAAGKSSAPAGDGGKANLSKQAGAPPANTGSSNPPSGGNTAGSNSGSASATNVGATLAGFSDVMSKVLASSLTDADAEAGLKRLEDIFADATPVQRARIYVLRALFNYKLDRDDVACRAANNALESPGLTSQDATDMKTIKKQLPNCS